MPAAGQERFRGLPKLYYRYARGVLLVFDVSDRPTFLHVEKWVNEIRSHVDADVPVVLVGNKCDTPVDKRVVTSREAREKATELKLNGYEETTARSGANVFMTFQRLVEDVVDKRAAEEAGQTVVVKYKKRLSKPTRSGSISRSSSSSASGLRNRNIKYTEPMVDVSGGGDAKKANPMPDNTIKLTSDASRFDQQGKEIAPDSSRKKKCCNQ